MQDNPHISPTRGLYIPLYILPLIQTAFVVQTHKTKGEKTLLAKDGDYIVYIMILSIDLFGKCQAYKGLHIG